MIQPKQTTVDDIYRFDEYFSTPGVRQGLLELAANGDPAFTTEDTDDGPGIYYRAPHGEMIAIGRSDVKEPAEPSLEGMQLAAGPSDTRTDAPKGYGATGEAKAVDPTNRQRLAGFLTDSLVNLGADRYKARERVESFIGGTSSRLPANLGLADFVPFLGTFLQSEEAAILLGKSKEAAERGDIKTAAIEGVGGALGLIPGVAGTVKYGKKAAQELAPAAADVIESGLRKSGMIQDIVPPGPNVVSTRLPTAKKATEDPLQSKLTIDYAASKSDPEAFAHNMGLIKQYPNFASKARTPEKQAEDFISQVKDNLLYLYDQVPNATRQRSKLWYDGARNITDRFSGEYGVPDQAVSGVLAVLSPQKDWFMNVSLGQRVIDIARNQAGHRWDDAMEQTASRIFADPKYKPIVDLVRGKSFAQIKDADERALWLRTYDQAFNPANHRIVMPEGGFGDIRLNQDGSQSRIAWGSLNEIGKAIAILENPSLANISTMLGQQHKVRNFYNNIYAPGDPAGHVTIDTHAVAAGLLRPLSGNSREVKHNFGTNVKGEVGPKNSSVTGVQGTYGLFAEAYRRAAQERGVLPRQMQSITWEAVRGLFPDTFKTAKNSQLIDDIWVKYRKGKLSLEEARNEVISTAGGIRPPEWERTGLRSLAPEEGRATVNAGELPGAGVPGRNTGGSGRVESPTGNQTGVTGGRKAPTKGAK